MCAVQNPEPQAASQSACSMCSYFTEAGEPTKEATWLLVILTVCCVVGTVVPVIIQVTTLGNSVPWTGTFGSSTTCNQSRCCCTTSDIKISTNADGMLNVNVSVAGNGCVAGTYPQSIPKPKSATMVISPAGAPTVVVMSDDGEQLDVYTAQGGVCNGKFGRISSSG